MGKKGGEAAWREQPAAAFAGHVQRVGSAWLLECRQRNAPFDVGAAALAGHIVFTPSKKAAVFYYPMDRVLFEFLRSECASRLEFDATYLERVAD